ncbi:MAG: DNA repair protein RecO [Bacteroidia bacterium]|nr:DNA repair protein RecO [Bacteroidia bacterium]
MLEKTRGIILHQIKYTDSGIIAQLYTRKFGRQSFLIKGMRNRKTGKHNILFQPMFILDLEMHYKASREMQVLKEFSVSFTPYNIHSNIKKSCVAIFLGEVLTSILKEEGPHEEMYDYIEESIIYFDRCNENFVNFHIAFLTGLSSFLGFEPGTRTSTGDTFFDMTNGKFVPIPPVHGNYANEEVSNILADFFIASYDTISNITLTGTMRNEVLETLVRYYSLHLPGLKKINSLEVLKDVFS